VADNVIDLIAHQPTIDSQQLIETLDDVVTLARRARTKLDKAFVEGCLGRDLPGDSTFK
jgi:hypothetical protein